jgi:hypothetical protein
MQNVRHEGLYAPKECMKCILFFKSLFFAKFGKYLSKDGNYRGSHHILCC